MDNIDVSHQKLQELISQSQDFKDTIITEQDTRLKLINPILMNVLGWPEKEIFTESYSGGDFIDYKLTVNGLSRLVVEAKRDSRELERVINFK